jgi:hypothetical protein
MKALILILAAAPVLMSTTCGKLQTGKDDTSMYNHSIPSVEESQEYTPNSFNYAAAREKNLIGADNTLTDDYLRLQSAYVARFYSYLNKAVDITQYDDALTNSKYNFVPIAQETQNVYQRYGSFGNKYIYLRNNFHIERLSSDDLHLLESAGVGEILEDMVKRTFKDVITIRYDDNEEAFDAIYDIGALTGLAVAPNNALVLGLSYAWEFDGEGSVVSIESEAEKEKIAADLALKMQEELSAGLGIPESVFVYS